MSKVLPILFNTDMVRAILEGRKTVTRRCVKLPKWIEKQDDGLYTLFAEGTCYENKCFEDIATYLNKPYCPGDILYVRETWCDDRQYTKDDTPGIFFYKADEKNSYNEKWHPSIHMPKEAARIFLKVKDVRVKRLQECGKGWCLDIEKEGVVTPQDPILYTSDDKYHDALREEFQKLWNSTIKKSDLEQYGWDANPWVWVIEFERCEKPVEF